MGIGDILTFINPNSIGLVNVVNNACAALEYKLLAIENNITPNHASPCLYDPGKIDFSCCSISETEHAHLYFSTNIQNEHCIILFARIMRFKDNLINDLVIKFYNSIERLKNQNASFPNINFFKKLQFYIYFFGDNSLITTADYNMYREIFSRKLERRLGYNTNELDGCIKLRRKPNIKSLTIYEKNNSLEISP